MSSADPKTLLIVAVRCDHPVSVKRRMETILAATATYAIPPDTEACAYAQHVDDLTPEDTEALAHFMGASGVERLNLQGQHVDR